MSRLQYDDTAHLSASHLELAATCRREYDSPASPGWSSPKCFKCPTGSSITSESSASLMIDLDVHGDADTLAAAMEVMGEEDQQWAEAESRAEAEAARWEQLEVAAERLASAAQARSERQARKMLERREQVLEQRRQLKSVRLQRAQRAAERAEHAERAQLKSERLYRRGAL